jgi:hypothetical protein
MVWLGYVNSQPEKARTEALMKGKVLFVTNRLFLSIPVDCVPISGWVDGSPIVNRQKPSTSPTKLLEQSEESRP